jgi:Leucine-rich repeat (LRR) protein
MKNPFTKLKTTSQLVAASLLIVGCDSGGASSSAGKIVGGAVPALDSPAQTSTVALLSDDGDKWSAFCSGTLIAKNLVVTAAHCLDRIKSAREMRVLFGASDSPDGSEAIKVSRFATYLPEGSRYFPNFDIGWVKLAKNAPKNYRPVEIWHHAGELTVGRDAAGKTPYLFAGYGFQSTSCHDESCFGVRLEVEGVLREPVYHTSHLSSLMIFKNPIGTGTCNGDSGGPTYMKRGDKWYLVGATNGVNSVMNGEVFANYGENSCEMGQSINTFVGSYAAWIEKSSGVALGYDAQLNPRPTVTEPAPAASSEAPQEFAAWYQIKTPQNPAWFTTDLLAYEAAVSAAAGAEREAIFQSPQKILEVFAQKPELTLTAERSYGWNRPDANTQIEDVGPIGALPLTSLTLVGQAVSDYAPLGHLQDLKRLIINNNTVLRSEKPLTYNLSFIEKLGQLEFLDLSGTPGLSVREIDWSQLKNLKELRINDAKLSSIEFLKQLPSLERLYLSGNRIGTIQALSALKNLKVLHLDGNQIESVQALKALSALEEVNLRSNRIKLVASLEGLTQLKKLQLDNNLITSLEPLTRGEHGALQYISASNNSVEDLTFLGALKGLSYVNIRNNPIKNGVCPESIAICFTTSHAPLNSFADYCQQANGMEEEEFQKWSSGPLMEMLISRFTIGDFLRREKDPTGGTSRILTRMCERAEEQLKKTLTSFKGCALGSVSHATDLGLLKGLTGLKYVNLDYCVISDITPLAALPQLEQLSLRKNFITDLAPLWGLPQLTVLNVSENEVNSLQGMTAPRLKKFVMQGPLLGGTTTLSSLEDLGELPALEELDLSYQGLTNIEPLAAYRTLTDLNVAHNRIESLEALAGRERLTINAFANPVQKCPQRVRGCILATAEEKTPAPSPTGAPQPQ